MELELFDIVALLVVGAAGWELLKYLIRVTG
jgi:uncharacterized membrane protein SpoIIM required for sporulation